MWPFKKKKSAKMKEIVIYRDDERSVFEFHCDQCPGGGGYFRAKLRVDLNGAHCVCCPNCGHEHFRIINNGVITEERAPDSLRDKKYVNMIKGPRSAWSRDSLEIAARKKRTEYSKVRDPGGFLGELWMRTPGGA